VIFKPFFPNPAFGWTFYGIIVALLLVAALIDLRCAIVPKALALTTLFLGVTSNVVRGAWLGGLDQEAWHLGKHGTWIGAADGLLFALAGFFVGFGIFFFMWIIGACAGGDVKLFAALSAWVGPYISPFILIVATIALIVLLGLRLVILLIFQGPQAPAPAPADRKGKGTMPAVPRDPRYRRGMTYSLPVAIATALTLLWFFRYDLNLAQPRPHTSQAVARDIATMHQ
jgi:Flp pilus assembly protein protease CpaA